MSIRETFSWTPLVGMNGTVKYRVLSAQFGDGYQQVAADGINNKIESWPVSFTGTTDEIRPIKDFMDRHAGYQSFYWTPPMGDKGMYRSFDITITPVEGDIVTLSTVFEQAF